MIAGALKRLRPAAGLARLTLAVFILWTLLADTPARLAARRLDALPALDYAAEVEFLRQQGRFGEALVLADDGLASGLDPDASERLRAERAKAVDAQSSLLRRLGEAGLGAISGTGTSLESLAGAVAADFFLVGDVRDLFLQGVKLAADGDADEVILALSAVGAATTLAPQFDWAPAVLKTARKSGAMSRGLAEFVTRSAKARRFDDVADLARDAARISERASPAGAIRILANADSPADARALADFVTNTPGGAAALHVAGADGARLVLRNPADAALHTRLVDAARRGPRGIAALRSGSLRPLLRPHPLVGMLKGVAKGNLPELAQRVIERLGRHASWLLPLAAAWVFVELALLARRVLRRRPRAVASA